MTRWNHSIDNPSPLISYAPAWMWHIPTNDSDPLTPNYANGSTATTTDGIGATMTFSFVGTGVWVYGAKRSNHGYYNVSINDDKTTTLDGNDPNDLFHQLVFGKGNLDLGYHTLTIVNAGSLTSDTVNGWFDVDWIVWETEYDGPGGPKNAQVTENTFDNDHPRFQYTPASAWDQQTYSSGTLNGTTEVTSASQAEVTFTFDGDAVALYGTIDPSHGNYTAFVDNQQLRTSSGKWNSTEHQQMLYYAEGLGAGQHNLVVQNVPASSSQGSFNVDFVKTWIARGGSGGPGTVPPAKKGGISKGAIAGGVIGGVALLAALSGIVLLFCWRRKQNLKRAAQRSVNRFVVSTATDPFGDAGSKSTNFDAERSRHQSMSSVSSSLTNCSTRQLVETIGDNAFPMSRLPPNPDIASTSSLHPNSNLYYRGSPGSSLQNHSLSNPPFPSSDDLDVPVISGQEASSPSRTRRTSAERQAQIHGILGGDAPQPPSSLGMDGGSLSSATSALPSSVPTQSPAPAPALRAQDAGSLSAHSSQSLPSRPEHR